MTVDCEGRREGLHDERRGFVRQVGKHQIAKKKKRGRAKVERQENVK